MVYILRNDISFDEKYKLSANSVFIKGLVLSLNLYDAFVIILGNDSFVNASSFVFKSGSLFNLNTSLRMFGRVVSALGQCKETDRSFSDKINECFGFIERKASGIVDRIPITIPLRTGLKAVDSLLPIGRGQRELIIGDRQTGKTSIAVDTILNYVESNNYFFKSVKNLSVLNLREIVWFIYAAIGQKQSSVSQVHSLLLSKKASWFTSIVAATAAESAPLQFLAPYVACTLGEFIRDTLGGHCLVVYDDLSKHAVAYRQMSLLLRRPPGREAFPGDVFYVHSRLLERSGYLRNIFYHVNFNFFSSTFVFRTLVKRGTMTAFPIIETQAGDVSAYIPTNVISITDGQIFLETELFYKGIQPAINVGLSVSRVGSAAQPALLKKVAGSLKIDLAQFREIEGFAKLGAALDAHTQQLLVKGENLIEILKQGLHAPMSTNFQIFSLFFGLGFTANWLTQVSKTIKCFVNSFLANFRIKFSWFELFRLNCPGFDINSIKSVFYSFQIFIKNIGLTKTFNYMSLEVMLNLLINKYPMLYFDDFFLFYLLEICSVSVDSSLKLNVLRVKNILPAIKLSKTLVFENVLKNLFYKNKKILVKNIFKFNNNAFQKCFLTKIYGDFKNITSVTKFFAFVSIFFKFNFSLANNEFFLTNSKALASIITFIKLIVYPFLVKTFKVTDTIKEYLSFLQFDHVKISFFSKYLSFISTFSNSFLTYPNLYFTKKKILKAIVVNTVCLNFLYKYNLFVFFNSFKLSLGKMKSMLLSFLGLVKLNTFIFDDSLFERSKFLLLVLLLTQSLGSIKLLNANQKLTQAYANFMSYYFYTSLKFFHISSLLLFFGFFGSSRRCLLVVKYFFNLNVYFITRFFVWFLKTSNFVFNIIETLNFAVININFFKEIFSFVEFFKGKLKCFGFNHLIKTKYKNLSDFRVFIFAPFKISVDKRKAIKLILNAFYLTTI